MNASDPEGRGDAYDHDMIYQGAFDGRNHERSTEEIAPSVQTLCQIEGYHDGVGCFKCICHVDGEPKQA